MSGLPFRFIHASDLHLEMPLAGTHDIPEHLREAVVDAPYVAATRLFSTAIEKQVDFVILAGDVTHLHHAGPRAACFLARQFEQLAAKNIVVYWVEGEVDRLTDWPTEIQLPDNVHYMESGRFNDILHQRHGQAMARIVHTDSSLQLENPYDGNVFDAEEACLIAVSHCAQAVERQTESDITYWAMGGEHNRQTVFLPKSDVPIVHYPGSPQGRCFDEEGSHGATLIEIDSERHCRLETISLDTIVWQREPIELDGELSPKDFTELLAVRTSELIEKFENCQLMIAWDVKKSKTTESYDQRGNFFETALVQLRRQFGHNHPGAWTFDIGWSSTPQLPSGWYEEDSLRGEFLRQALEFEHDENQILSLEAYCAADEIDPQQLDPAVASMVSGGSHEKILQQVTALGAKLLSGTEGKPGDEKGGEF